jgi:hypothetical protein
MSLTTEGASVGGGSDSQLPPTNGNRAPATERAPKEKLPPKRRASVRNRRRLNASRDDSANENTASGPVAAPIVLSPDEIEADKKALTQFRGILAVLVQSSKDAPTPKPGFWASIHQPFSRGFYRLTSASLFGRSLGYEELVGKYASLLPVLEMPPNLVHAEMALLGLLALQSGRLSIAQSIFEEVRFLTSTATALVFVMRGVGRFVFVGTFFAFGAIYAAVFAKFFLAPFGRDSQFQPFESITSILTGPNVRNVICASIFGCLGSVVSILLRLSEFETTKGRSREFLFLSGSTLPIVGGIFAAVVAALLASNIVSFNFAGGQINIWLFVVIGFLSGFSERFTRNLLSVAEGRISPASARNVREQK